MGAAECPVEILSCGRETGEAALLAVQVTSRSPQGAICHGTGGILVDDGWLRMLGAGQARLTRSLPGWNRGKYPAEAQGWSGAMLVADDAVGGFFALNGGAIAGCAPGSIAYLAPDTLRWEDTGLGYSQFLCWSWSGSLAEFTADLRWPGWRDEIRGLHGDQVFGVYPPLWTEGPPIGQRSFRPVSIAEAFAFIADVHRQLG